MDAGVTPQPGTEYDLFTCTGTPSLGQVIIDAGSTGWDVYSARVDAEEGRVYIKGIAMRGDANGDGVVDAADFIAMKQNFGLTSGATRAQGNFDGDGDVDWADLQTLTSNFGIGGDGASSTTPEPAALSLLALGGLAVMRRRRR